MQDPPPGDDGGFTYLMQFTDGNRIDLGLRPLDKAGDITGDSLSVLLLDKDGVVGPLDPPSERDYLPAPPTAQAFADCCNEFWWVCPYVAKGLWRQEILYARHMLDQVVRGQLMTMLVWHIGVKTGFAVSPGKFGKYSQRHLDPELWQALLRTYAGADYDATWEALFTMCSLFERAAAPVAEHLGFAYPHDDARRVRAHLAHVRLLPADATEIYP
jgi:aminoglycoside 6-adenylyltransferase